MSRKHAVRNITEAGMSHAQDVHDRTVRYLVSMSIRMACFVLAVITPSPWRWGFAIGAIVLPWVAVLIANAGKEHGPPDETSVIEHAPNIALGPGRSADPGAPAAAAGPSGAAAGDASGTAADTSGRATGASNPRDSATGSEADGADSGADEEIIEPDLDSARGSGREDNGPDGEGPEIIIGELDADGERKNG
ncbi:hypothetical protein GCM10022261_30250 [Brevibacterium daeguense]|uniref:DUF3099 domain-containing protein n=1 Tax=Brevibacterium daeguense TaxID=909936 RepID=A0ABP8ENK2_9MICO|nr:DUF3099 domain-containing protein [Brevibacterium daeguense]